MVRGLCVIDLKPANSVPGEIQLLSQYIKNDIFRRQDLPKSYNHYHYICAFKVKEITKLNSELINKHTFPLILNNKVQSKLIEIDTNDDLKRYKGSF